MFSPSLSWEPCPSWRGGGPQASGPVWALGLCWTWTEVRCIVRMGVHGFSQMQPSWQVPFCPHSQLLPPPFSGIASYAGQAGPVWPPEHDWMGQHLLRQPRAPPSGPLPPRCPSARVVTSGCLSVSKLSPRLGSHLNRKVQLLLPFQKQWDLEKKSGFQLAVREILNYNKHSLAVFPACRLCGVAPEAK